MTLQLPPSLEDPSKESTLRGGPAFLLLPQAEDCLLRLCSVRDLKLGSMAGRGEQRRNSPGLQSLEIVWCLDTVY